MGYMKAMHTDAQEVLEAVAAVKGDPAELLSELWCLGWVTPTEREVALEHLREGRYGAVEVLLGGGGNG